MALTSAEREELLRNVPTLEEFWASFNKSKDELAAWQAEQAKWQAERDRWQAEHERWKAEHERYQAESDQRQKKRDRELDKLEKLIGDLGSSVGELIETLIAGRLWEKFKDTPYSRLWRAYRRVQIFDDKREIGEIDILLSDTDQCMAVEVKREPALRDVDHHLKRMELIRKFPPAETVGKKLVGAIAGGFVPPEVREYAHGQGFFVLELNGESVSLAETPPGFKAREW